MNANLRNDLLDVFGKLAAIYPNSRFGQLVCNIGDMSEAGVWDVEDEELLAEARRHLEHRMQCLGLEDKALSAQRM